MIRRLLIITGMSGSGKSIAVKALEDLGFFCVDNLPVVMLPQFLSLVKEQEIEQVAVVIDVRLHQPGFFEDGDAVLTMLNKQEQSFQILFLDCDDHTLSRRYAESRRPHPLSEGSIAGGLSRERELLAPFRGAANLLVDTTQLVPHELRQRLREHFSITPMQAPLQVNVMSFGFKYGAPLDAHFTFDMRFLPNPYWDKSLRHFNGLDQPVIEFLEKQPEALTFIDNTVMTMTHLLECFQKADRAFVTVAFGCTGGQHRSVFASETFARKLREVGANVVVSHRELSRYHNQVSASSSSIPSAKPLKGSHVKK